jgi:hypothetical protein
MSCPALSASTMTNIISMDEEELNMDMDMDMDMDLNDLILLSQMMDGK